MATITSGLTLSGTGATSDVLSINKSAALTVASPTVQVGTVNLTTTFATTLDELNGTKNTKDTFLYLLNSSSGVETITMQTLATVTGGTEAAPCVIAQSKGLNLRSGEFAFLPLEALAHVQFKGSAVTAQMEYGYWTRSN